VRLAALAGVPGPGSVRGAPWGNMRTIHFELRAKEEGMMADGRTDLEPRREVRRGDAPEAGPLSRREEGQGVRGRATGPRHPAVLPPPRALSGRRGGKGKKEEGGLGVQ